MWGGGCEEQGMSRRDCGVHLYHTDHYSTHVQFTVSEGQVVVGEHGVITRTQCNRDNSYIIESTLSVTATDMQWHNFDLYGWTD